MTSAIGRRRLPVTPMGSTLRRRQLPQDVLQRPCQLPPRMVRFQPPQVADVADVVPPAPEPDATPLACHTPCYASTRVLRAHHRAAHLGARNRSRAPAVGGRNDRRGKARGGRGREVLDGGGLLWRCRVGDKVVWMPPLRVSHRDRDSSSGRWVADWFFHTTWNTACTTMPTAVLRVSARRCSVVSAAVAGVGHTGRASWRRRSPPAGRSRTHGIGRLRVPWVARGLGAAYLVLRALNPGGS